MRRQTVRILRLSVGALLLLLGVIGGFVPILQGWIFIIAGLSVMAPESARARKALDWTKRKVATINHDRPGGPVKPGEATPGSRHSDEMPR